MGAFIGGMMAGAALGVLIAALLAANGRKG